MGARSGSSSKAQLLAEQIGSVSAYAVYNLDIEQLKTILSRTFDDIQVVALKIIESIADETLISIYQQGGKKIYDEKLPDNLLSQNKYQANIIYEEKVVGQVWLYYDDTDEVKPINFTNE